MFKIKRKKVFLLFFILSVLIIAPIYASAQSAGGSVTPGGSTSGTLNTGKASQSFSYTPMEEIPGFGKPTDFPGYVVAIYKFGIWTVGLAAMLMIIIGGYMYLTSAGNTASMGKAKGYITDAIIGLVMALAAWLILNTINPALVQIKTISSGTGTGTPTTPTTPGTPTTPTTPGTPTTPTANGYTYDPGIQNQTGDASSALNDMLNCMQPLLPDEAKRISSISDSAGMSRCTTTYSRPPCAHLQNSCHYGGTSCRGQSYAVDFGNEQYSSQIQQAASQCGGRVVPEGASDHVHVSTGNCGCN